MFGDERKWHCRLVSERMLLMILSYFFVIERALLVIERAPLSTFRDIKCTVGDCCRMATFGD